MTDDQQVLLPMFWIRLWFILLFTTFVLFRAFQWVFLESKRLYKCNKRLLLIIWQQERDIFAAFFIREFSTWLSDHCFTIPDFRTYIVQCLEYKHEFPVCFNRGAKRVNHLVSLELRVIIILQSRFYQLVLYMSGL